ncbi:peptidase family M48-domain-containing protein [Amylostereum chailletii]|nr:peptidase family M48-domain-containing protein [Amylostereum chailletii]
MLTASVRRTIAPRIQKSLRQVSTTGLACHRLSLLPSLSTSPLKHKSRGSLSRLSALSYPVSRPITTSAPLHARYKRFGDAPGVEGSDQPKSTLESFTVGETVVVLVAISAGAYYFVHLERVPETGRWRFMDITPQYEAKLWESSYQVLMDEFKGKVLPSDHVITRHIHRVVSRILEANDLGSLRSLEPQTNMPFESVLFGTEDRVFEDSWSSNTPAAPDSARKTWNLLVVNDSKMVNAMATPGAIVVFTGILPVCQDEEGLAAVLGHEIAHVVCRHTAESYSYLKVLMASAFLFDQAFGFGLGSLITTFIMELPNSRKHELEADKIGLKLMAKACYDPASSPAMFRRLGAMQKPGSFTLDFMETHPPSEKRVKALEGQLPEAYSIRAAVSDCGGMEDHLGRFRDSVQFSIG